jgi:Deoxyribonuclease NucA/NucB
MLVVILGGTYFGTYLQAKEHRERNDCQRSDSPRRVVLPVSKYPNIMDHVRDATAGRTRTGRWPRVLVKRSHGEDRRRDAAIKMSLLPPREGMDRDEYPPAVGRKTLSADVRYVPSSENRSAGAVMGNRIRSLCDGARFVLVSR